MNDKKIILLVEDEALVALAEKQSLEIYGYKVITANSGIKALNIVSSNNEIDLILMDIDLGDGIDGTETAAAILRERDIPVVFLSSHTEPDIVEKTEKITSYGYVVKNSGITVLDASIKMAFKLFEAKIKENIKEEALRESEKKYSSLFNTMTEGFALHEIICNPDGRPVDYSFLDINPAFENLTGLKKSDIIGKTVKTVLPETESYWIENYGRVALTGESISFVNFSVALNRYYHVVAFSPRKNQFATIFFDTSESVQLEKALKNTMLFQKRLLDAIPLPIFYKDKNRNFLGINRACEQFIGLSSEQLVGKSVYDFASLDMSSVYDSADSELFNSPGIHVYETQLITEDGVRHDIINYRSTFTDTEGNIAGLIGVINDITGQKKCYDTIKKSEEQYNSLFENSVMGISHTLPGGELIRVNNAYARMYGYADPVEMIGSVINVEQLYANPCERNIVLDAINSKGYMEPGGFTLVRRDGTLFNALVGAQAVRNMSGELLYYQAEHIDITKLKNAEEALCRSEKKYRQLHETMMDAFAIVDMEGRIQETNRSFNLMLGYEEAELYRFTYKDITPETWHDSETKIIDEQVMTRGYSDVYEKEYRRKDGTVFPVEIRTFLIRDTEGRAENMWAIVRDITARRRAEYEVKTLIAEKELTLKETHHRMKNFMNTIRGLITLQISSLDNHSAVSALRNIEGRIYGMMTLYDKLYRPYNDRISVADFIPSLIDEILAIFPNVYPVKVEKKIDDFVLDAKRLQSLGIIINEILTNIMKHAFPGRDDGLIKISVSLTDSRVVLIIRDNGVGFPESAGCGKSTGFGIQLVNMLAEQMGGSTRIEQSEGTEFILEFP